MRLAVISDIHGNSFALEAVLADIARQAPDQIVNLGDVLASPIAPRETAELLSGRNIVTIRGNHDRWMTTLRVEAQAPVDRFATAQLTDAQHDWLATLPATAVVEDVYLCHATPTSDEAMWLDTLWDGRTTTLPDEDEVTRKADGIVYPVILCGHTHIPRAVRLHDGRQVINPGSVGLQTMHGSPDARYAILDRRDGRWSASFRTVAYDTEAAARAAEANGFPQWREALIGGWATPVGLFG
ncbi:MAG: Serine/threonine protein phosphatase [Devosia sp.]|nr:Serine/threonine protein phosphatase [Devosia sp.]